MLSDAAPTVAQLVADLQQAKQSHSIETGPFRAAVSIAGQTATGKTDFAFNLAKAALAEGMFSRVDLISVDSRQIFADIQILSGADVPSDFQRLTDSKLKYPFFGASDQQSQQQSESAKIYLHGVAMLDAKADWSVYHFQQFSWEVMRFSWARGGLVVLVGGTGLYHRHVFNVDMTVQPGPQRAIREQLALASVPELQGLADQQNPVAFAAMNDSDRVNPRRLIRLIEQADNNQTSQMTDSVTVGDRGTDVPRPDFYSQVVLQAPLEEIEAAIANRIEKRLALGALSEVAQLATLVEEAIESSQQPKVDWPILSATGVKELLLVIEEKLSVEEAVALWIRRERKYAKQQATWWKKQ